MMKTVQKVNLKSIIKNPLKLRQIALWKDSFFNKSSSDFHPKERASFDETTEFLDNCINFNKEDIEYMLKCGVNIDCCDKDNLTALHQACINCKLELVEYLLSKHANINAIDKEGWTPLHIAASVGSLELAKFLIDHGAQMDLANFDGDLPVSLVDEKENPHLIVFFKQEMKKRNIDEASCRNLEKSVMMEDVSKWKSSGMYKPPIDPVNKSTPLHVASSKNYLDILKELIPLLNSREINAQDSDGWTSLHAAAHWGNEEACMLLIKAGADVDIVTNANETVLDIADPLLKDQLTEDINIFKLETMETVDLFNQNSLRSDNGNRRSISRSSIGRQSVEWKKNTQSKDPFLERQIYSSAAHKSDISLLNEDVDISPRSKDYVNIIETVEKVDRSLPRVIEVDETKTFSTITITSSSNVNTKDTESNPSIESDQNHPQNLTGGDNTPDLSNRNKEYNVHNSIDYNNGATCDISEASSYSSESEKGIVPPVVEVKMRSKRLSSIMAPSKCEESEANRREKARRVRSNRRSTQAISLETVHAIKQRELEIINSVINPKDSGGQNDEGFLSKGAVEKEIIVHEENTQTLLNDIVDNKIVNDNTVQEEQRLTELPKERKEEVEVFPATDELSLDFSDHVDGPKRKLQHNHSLNLSPQTSSPLNFQRPSSISSNLTTSHQAVASNAPERKDPDRAIFKVPMGRISKSNSIDESSRGGSFIARPVFGTSRLEHNDGDTPVNVLASTTVLQQEKVQSSPQSYVSKYAASFDGLSQDDIQSCKLIATRLTNEITAKMDLQMEVSKLKQEIQDLKDSRDVVDSTMKMSRGAGNDKIFIMESELVKTKEENKKLKLQNEALLRVISKIQHDLEMYKEGQLGD